MEQVTYTFGQRILHAARQAVAMHLEQVAVESSCCSRGQRVAIGRAGPQVIAGGAPRAEGITDLSKDGRLPTGGGRDGGVAVADPFAPGDAPSRPAGFSRDCSAEGAD
jgi:hypothetical protein